MMRSTPAAAIPPAIWAITLGDQVGSREALAHNQSEADGWVEVAAGDVSDGINHGDDGEAECKGNSGESNTQRREGGGK
jgi:hypothetical protein